MEFPTLTSFVVEVSKCNFILIVAERLSVFPFIQHLLHFNVNKLFGHCITFCESCKYFCPKGGPRMRKLD